MPSLHVALAAATSAGASDAALTVSLIALAISASVAGWNVLKYVLDGGRVRVKLLRGYLDDHSLISVPFRSEGKGLHPEMTPRLYHQEVGVLTVENLGRTAVTISQPSFDLGLYWTKGRWRPWHRTVGPHLYEHREAKTETIVRLEPFDSATFILDAAAIFGSLPTNLGRRRVRVRGTVRVAGKRFQRRSSWFGGWIVSPEQLVLDEQMTPGKAAYHAIFRAASQEEGLPSAGMVAWRVQKLYDRDEAVTDDLIETAIVGEGLAAKKYDSHSLSLTFLVRDALNRHGYQVQKSSED